MSEIEINKRVATVYIVRQKDGKIVYPIRFSEDEAKALAELIGGDYIKEEVVVLDSIVDSGIENVEKAIDQYLAKDSLSKQEKIKVKELMEYREALRKFYSLDQEARTKYIAGLIYNAVVFMGKVLALLKGGNIKAAYQEFERFSNMLSKDAKFNIVAGLDLIAPQYREAVKLAIEKGMATWNK